MAKNYSGRDYLVYVSDAAPTSAANHTNYTLLGLSQDLSLDRSRGALDKSNKDDGDNSTFVAGRRNVTVSFSYVWDHTSNAGQDMVSDAYDSSAGTLWVLATTTTSSDVEWYGSGVVTQYNHTFSDESISTANVTVQISGAFTEAVNT